MRPLFREPRFKSSCFGASVSKAHLRTASPSTTPFGPALCVCQMPRWARAEASQRPPWALLRRNLLLSVPGGGTGHRPVRHIIPELDLLPRQGIRDALAHPGGPVLKSPAFLSLSVVTPEGLGVDSWPSRRLRTKGLSQTERSQRCDRDGVPALALPPPPHLTHLSHPPWLAPSQGISGRLKEGIPGPGLPQHLSPTELQILAATGHT